jgi:hypothetical protein
MYVSVGGENKFRLLALWRQLATPGIGARVIINQGRVRRRRKNTYYTYVDTKLSDIIYITPNRLIRQIVF